VRSLLGTIGRPFLPLAEVFRSHDLRRLQLSWGCFYVGEWAHVVALAVVAYQAGGATEVGLVGLIRLLPVGLAVPFASLLADRYRRERVLFYVHLGRAAAIGAAGAVLLAGGPTPVVYALAALAALSSTAFRPAQWALLPLLARSPRELVAANASSSTLEGLAIFVGPALAGILLALSDPWVVFAVSSGASALAALLVAPIGPTRVAGSLPLLAAARAETLAGFRTLAAEKGPRLLIGLFGAQTLVRGLLNVFIVVAAIELLGMGNSGVGYLNSAFGIGGILGALAGVFLAGRRRLATPFALGLAIWGAPVAALGLWREAAPALIALAIVGAGNSVLDVAGLTMLQRTVDDQVLARVFGVLETLAVTAGGLGAVLAPALIALLGERAAILATAAFLPALALIAFARLRQIDAAAAVPEREFELLRSLPIFAPLPPVTTERLACRLERLAVPAGEAVVREGDPGERFYVVGEGELQVTVDGQAQRMLHPGDFFGEIALLKRVPRTATVTARTAVVLYALERDVFVSAVSGHPQSAESAEAVISRRLSAIRVPTAPL
jgi:MFS family permease